MMQLLRMSNHGRIRISYFATRAQIGVLRLPSDCPKSSPPQILAEFLYLLWLSHQDSCGCFYDASILVGHCAPLCSRQCEPRDKNEKLSAGARVIARIPFVGASREEKCDESLLAACVLTAATLYPRQRGRHDSKQKVARSLAHQRSVQSYKWAFVFLPPRLCLLGALIYGTFRGELPKYLIAYL